MEIIPGQEGGSAVLGANGEQGEGVKRNGVECEDSSLVDIIQLV